MLAKARHVAPHDVDIHAELGLGELRAGRDLSLEALGLPALRRIDRHVGRADEEVRLAGHLAAGGQFAAIANADRGLDQRAGIEIEHGLGVRLIARGRIVAAQHQKIAQAERRRAEQVALQREAIAVAAGELQHRLDAAALQDRGGCKRAKMRARARAVRDIDRVGEVLQRQRLVEQILRVAGDRRRDFRRDDKTAGTDRLFKLATRTDRGHCGLSRE